MTGGSKPKYTKFSSSKPEISDPSNPQPLTKYNIATRSNKNPYTGPKLIQQLTDEGQKFSVPETSKGMQNMQSRMNAMFADKIRDLSKPTDNDPRANFNTEGFASAHNTVGAAALNAIQTKSINIGNNSKVSSITNAAANMPKPISNAERTSRIVEEAEEAAEQRRLALVRSVAKSNAEHNASEERRNIEFAQSGKRWEEFA
jgi:hypothetical protein